MERLTERYKDPIANTVLIKECGDKICKNICDDIEYDCSKCGLEKALEKLADYEDLEEQGLLVRLPDDLNRVLYQINYRWTKCTKYGERRNKCEIYSCERECDSREEYYIVEVDLRYIRIGNYYDRLGKFLFFTREEAEKKLEEFRN